MDLRIPKQNGDTISPIIWMESPRYREVKELFSRIICESSIGTQT